MGKQPYTLKKLGKEILKTMDAIPLIVYHPFQ